MLRSKPMSKINNFLLIILVFVVLFLGINAVKKTDKKSAGIKAVSSVSKQEENLNSQENEGGNVTVKVKPKVLKIGEKPSFNIVFETHSVDLAFDVAQISSFVDDKSNIYSNSNWKGTVPGGHHREGTLTFNTVLSETKFVELIIKDVGGVSQRKLKWEL